MYLFTLPWGINTIIINAWGIKHNRKTSNNRPNGIYGIKRRFHADNDILWIKETKNVHYNNNYTLS